MSCSNNARNFQLTLNGDAMDYYEETVDYLQELGANYIYSCLEEHKKLTLHIHIYVQFEKCKRICYKKTHGAHVEVCGGTPRQNMDYIEKMKRQYGLENILDEIGEVRLTVKDNLAISLMDMELGEVTKRDFRIWKEIHNIRSYTPLELYKPDVKVFYIWGPPKRGKSKWIFDHYPNVKMDRVKYCNGFWQGVNTHASTEGCWYDDWRDSHMPASEFISFIDYYRNQMNVKFCPSWINNYKYIFITTVQNPDKIYSNVTEEQREQWDRRMTKIDIEEYNEKQNFFKDN